jgi:hypothetical protein
MAKSQRASDKDRDGVAAILRDALADGRLDNDEFAERLDAAYRAKTFGELDTLTVDLPTSAVAPGATDRAPAAQQPTSVADSRADRGLRAAWVAWAGAVSINLVIWLMVSLSTGEAIYFWPMWVAGPWGAVLVVGTVTRGFIGPSE